MYKLKYKKLHKLLKNNSLIANSITETLYALNNIEIFLRDQLPAGLREHVKPLNISGNKLVLMVDSPAWKSKLRFLLPDFEKRLQKYTTNQINQISVKVIPNPECGRKPARIKETANRPPLSSASQSSIKSLADGMDDSRLKESLLKLSRNRH